MENTNESLIPSRNIASWKMIYDGVLRVITGDYNEDNLLKLTNIVKNKEFSNLIVFNQNPALTFDAYERISKIYQTFTTWLLGQFYYMLSDEKFTR